MTSWLCLSLFGLGLLSAPYGAAEAAPSPKMLLETVDLSSLAISPDGRRVAFRQERASVERNTYETGWYVQVLDGATPALRIADAGEPLRDSYGPSLTEPPQWSPDGHWIYYRALIDGGVQVWRAASDGARAEAVSHDPGDVESFALSADGRRLIYVAGAAREAIQRAEQAEADQGVHIDGSVPLGQGLYRSGYINGRLADQRFTGAWMDRGGLLADQPKHQVVVDLATLTSRDASAQDIADFAARRPVASLKASPASSPWSDLRTRSASSGAVAFVQAAATKTSLRVAVDATTAASVACAAQPCQNVRIAGLAWRPDHDEVIFTTDDRETGGQSLYDWDVARGAVRRITSGPGLIGGGRGEMPGETCAIASEAAVCVTASADVPPRLERIDLKTGQRRMLYEPNAALIAARGPPVQFLRWTDDQGRTFTGQYFPPAASRNAGPAPLFITYYTCPGYLRGGMGDEWPLASFAGAGIAALCVRAPAADPSKPDRMEAYEAALSGLRRIIGLLQARGLIDPTRVGLGGLSFGSEVVMWTAMNSHLLAAGAVASPALTPTYFQLHDLQGDSFRSNLMLGWGLGTPEQTPERWKRLSPAFNVDKIRTPLLMQMPEQEYLEALDYVVPLARSTTPVELYVFPHEPHMLIEPRHQMAAYDRNLDWFRFWLQGYVDPDPLMAAQYQRWRALRSRFGSAAAPPATSAGSGAGARPTAP
jgi:dipeptidyl aminopeptidase/acylaminoacyl peptidase